MLIFELVSPVLVGIFIVATVVELLAPHKRSGDYFKIALIFLLLAAVALWFEVAPWTEPFPGIIQAIVVIATVFQLFMKRIVLCVQSAKPKKILLKSLNKVPRTISALCTRLTK